MWQRKFANKRHNYQFSLAFWKEEVENIIIQSLGTLWVYQG